MPALDAVYPGTLMPPWKLSSEAVKIRNALLDGAAFGFKIRRHPDNVGARLGQGHGHGKSDAPPRAGDDGGLSGEVEKAAAHDMAPATGRQSTRTFMAPPDSRAKKPSSTSCRLTIREISRRAGIAPVATSLTASSKSSRWYSRAPNISSSRQKNRCRSISLGLG